VSRSPAQHPLCCQCLDCLGGVSANPTRVYTGPGRKKAALKKSSVCRADAVVTELLSTSAVAYVAAWDEQARAAGLSRRAWMRRVLNEAAGVR
jgi:hypothetical protein